MGMFLSQYTMLKALGYGEDRYVKEETEKILEPYRLFVLVLHAPERHNAFHQKFTQLFERLDYLTGSNLLFMGIAKPSYNWYKRNENRDYFGIWEKEQLIKSFHEIRGADGSLTSYGIAQALNIDYDDLPCLIISPDFQSDRFIVLKTGEEHIENQMTEMGYFAGTITGKADINSRPFKELLQSIDYYKRFEFFKIQDNLGRLLADKLSFSVPANTHFGIDAEQHSKKVFQKFKNRIERSGNEEEIENVKMNLLTSLASKFNSSISISNSNVTENVLLSPSANYEFKNIENHREIRTKVNFVENAFMSLRINEKLLEPETNIIVSTTEAVFKMFNERPNKDTLDFSPLVLGLSKIFEIEINLSVVHWVRKHLNIEMPDYYKKFKPDFIKAVIAPDSTIVPNPKGIDFNMHKGAKWIPPGIGQSELVVRSLFKNKLLIESFSDTEIPSLLNVWAPIRESRNRAAHNEIMHSDDLQNVATNMNTLIESNNLSKILQLKKRYQGGVVQNL